jgi:1-aminocyclopropane-1-carboxylate deaminase/D-cysteine desulfhydrase-like pyridoxal-dependent ACC family enzyme
MELRLLLLVPLVTVIKSGSSNHLSNSHLQKTQTQVCVPIPLLVQNLNATATDNCAVTSLTYFAGVLEQEQHWEGFNKGITTVTWSATDGIAATCSFTVTVLDNRVPVITCPIATSTNKTQTQVKITIPLLVQNLMPQPLTLRSNFLDLRFKRSNFWNRSNTGRRFSKE